MVSILDLCSGKWEREEMVGDFEWEVVCTGWHPGMPQTGVSLAQVEAFDASPRRGSTMPADLALIHLDEFVDRMALH